MKKRQLSRDKERKMADVIQSGRGDLSDWADRPAKARVGKGAGVVFSLRFSREELVQLRSQAEARRTTLSGLIRRAALEYGTNQTPRFDFAGTIPTNINLENWVSVAPWSFQPDENTNTIVISPGEHFTIDSSFWADWAASLIKSNVETFSKSKGDPEAEGQKAA